MKGYEKEVSNDLHTCVSVQEWLLLHFLDLVVVYTRHSLASMPAVETVS